MGDCVEAQSDLGWRSGIGYSLKLLSNANRNYSYRCSPFFYCLAIINSRRINVQVALKNMVYTAPLTTI